MALWQGVNQGVRTGLAFVSDMENRQQRDRLAADARAERTEERAYQRGRDAKADARLQAQTDLAVAGQADQEVQRLTQAGLSGAGVDQPRLEAAKGRASKARANAHKAMGYEDRMAESNAVLERLNQGAGIESLSVPELGALSYPLKRPITDFIDTPERPSPVSMAFSVFSDAAQSGDMETMIAAGNELLRPEIEDGIGSKNAKGELIVDKFLNSLKVSGKTATGNLTVRARRADGTEYDYEAPITEGRVAGGKPKAIDLDSVMDRLSKTGELLEAINSDPKRAAAIAGNAAEWEKAGGREQFQQLYRDYIAAGGDPKTLKSKVSTRTVNRGGYDEDITTDEHGNEVSRRRVERTPTPKEADPAGDEVKRAQAEYYRQRGGLGAVGGRGGTGGGAGGLFIANTETGEVMPYDGGEIPEGFSPPFKAGTKAQALGPEEKRAKAEKVLEELRKDYRAKIQAGGPLGNAGPAPTIQDALREVDAADRAFAPPPPPRPPVQPLQDTRTAQPPLRNAGVQEGATAVNRQTGQRIQFRNGKWEPVQ
jgi:hypothetical protein